MLWTQIYIKQKKKVIIGSTLKYCSYYRTFRGSHTKFINFMFVIVAVLFYFYALYRFVFMMRWALHYEWDYNVKVIDFCKPYTFPVYFTQKLTKFEAPNKNLTHFFFCYRSQYIIKVTLLFEAFVLMAVDYIKSISCLFNA